MEGKVYTNMNLKRALGKTGDYIAITMEAYVHNVEPIREVGDKKVLNFTTFINNRGSYIKHYCGDCPQENADGGISARVSMWDSPQVSNGLATRFSKYMSNKSGKNVVVNLTGSIKVKEEVGKDGRTYKNVYITADEFWEARVTEKRSSSASNNSQPQQTAPAQPQQTQQAQQPQPQPEEPKAIPMGGVDGFISIDDDEELPF